MSVSLYLCVCLILTLMLSLCLSPSHTRAQVLTEALSWIGGALTDFLLPAFNVPALLGWAKEGLGSANAATRTAATQLLGVMHSFLGEGAARRCACLPASLSCAQQVRHPSGTHARSAAHTTLLSLHRVRTGALLSLSPHPAHHALTPVCKALSHKSALAAQARRWRRRRLQPHILSFPPCSSLSHMQMPHTFSFFALQARRWRRWCGQTSSRR